MKTFALRNRDLVLSGDQFALVSGAARLQQQLGLAMSDPYGSDRFHPDWGSTLHQYVGLAYSPATGEFIKAEVNRVIRYMLSVQNTMMTDRSVLALKPTITAAEIVADISEVRVDQQQDSLSVKVSVRTASQQQVDVLTTTGRMT